MNQNLIFYDFSARCLLTKWFILAFVFIRMSLLHIFLVRILQLGDCQYLLVFHTSIYVLVICANEFRFSDWHKSESRILFWQFLMRITNHFSNPRLVIRIMAKNDKLLNKSFSLYKPTSYFPLILFCAYFFFFCFL